MKYHILPAVIAKSQEELDGCLKRINSYSKWIHLDIMDNKFVPNSSLYFDFRLSGYNTEAHLMVEKPIDWIKQHGDSADKIIFHIESTDQPKYIIKLIKSINKIPGISLNPSTPVSRIIPYLNFVEHVLVMTVEPGYYGSSLCVTCFDKVKELRKFASALDIEVDGSINDKTIMLALKAGANIFVSGSYIMKADNIGEAINRLQMEVENVTGNGK